MKVTYLRPPFREYVDRIAFIIIQYFKHKVNVYSVDFAAFLQNQMILLSLSFLDFESIRLLLIVKVHYIIRWCNALNILVVHISVHNHNNVHINLAKTRYICSCFRAKSTKCVELVITHLRKLCLATLSDGKPHYIAVRYECHVASIQVIRCFAQQILMNCQLASS